MRKPSKSSGGPGCQVQLLLPKQLCQKGELWAYADKKPHSGSYPETI